MKHVYEPLAYGPVPDAGNFWRTTADPATGCDALQGEATCDVAIVGSGFTGLNAALTLAKAGLSVVVLDAEVPGFGASGRNGGFCCLGGSKISAGKMRKRHGETATHAYAQAERHAIEHVSALLETHQIDADTHSDGETLVAHRPSEMAGLRDYAEEIHHFHGLDCHFTPAEAMAAEGMASPEFHGAITGPLGFALNPLKYHIGLLDAARAAGAVVHGLSPVTRITHDQGHHQLITPNGQVTAQKLIIATNGYSSDDIPPWMAGRYLPAQSNILVTRPLTADELSAQGWTTRQMCFDTRNLLHYFRLLPDNRMLFGMRGAVKTTGHALNYAAAITRRDFEATFPRWRKVETQHSWSGLVCLSRRLTPFVGPIDGLDNAFASFAYHGNGVSMGSYCGTLIAAQVLGNVSKTPDILRTPPRRFELGRLRRWALPLAYAWYARKDR